MAGFKILVMFVVFHIVNSRPLFKDIHIKRNFEFSFKPPLLPIGPITFIKEKVMHLGHVVAKRSPFELASTPGGDVNNRDSLYEIPLDKEFGAGTLFPPPPPPPPPPEPPVMFTPEQPASSSAQPPITSSGILVSKEMLSRLPLDGQEVIVITPVPPPPPIVSVPAVVPPPPPAPVPIPGPPPPVLEPPKQVQGNLLTDIARVEDINAYLKAVEALGIPPPPASILIPPPPPPIEAVLPVLSSNSIEVEAPKPPPPPPVEEKTSPLVKGSRLALYFGNILLQVMSEVISSARSALSQYSPPAPI